MTRPGAGLAVPAERIGSSDPALGPVFVDGHVHVYPRVGLLSLFAALLRNVPGAGGAGEQRTCLLLLADPRGVDGFGRLSRLGDRGAHAAGLPDWTVEARGEQHVRFVHRTALAAVFLRGQQLVTAEGLEVLATGHDGQVPEGLPLRRTLDEVRARRGWCTIAWGAGKWLGRRGRLVMEAVETEAASADVMLGDNGGRPWCWPRVPQFAAAAGRGMRILPGTDPLPIRGDEARIGRYGFEIALRSRAESPAAALRDALADPAVELVPRGKRVGAWRFVANQLRLRAGADPRRMAE